MGSEQDVKFNKGNKDLEKILETAEKEGYKIIGREKVYLRNSGSKTIIQTKAFLLESTRTKDFEFGGKFKGIIYKDEKTNAYRFYTYTIY